MGLDAEQIVFGEDYRRDMITPILRFCLAAVTAAVFTASVQAAAIGEPAPDFTLTDIEGGTHTLSALKGKTVVLEWVNPECPFVKKHYDKSGNIPSLQKTAKADGVVWLSINSAAQGKQGDYDAVQVAMWRARTGAAPTAYLRDSDGKVGKLYGAKTTPHIFVITPEGKLAYAGAIDSISSTDVTDIAKAENYVTAALAAVKNKVPVARPTTQPYGCSVKY